VCREAPDVDIIIKSGTTDLILDNLDKGRVDIAIGTFHNLPEASWPAIS
jgi:DNA-binding transcriptional LysR family regulator